MPPDTTRAARQARWREKSREAGKVLIREYVPAESRAHLHQLTLRLGMTQAEVLALALETLAQAIEKEGEKKR